MSEPRRAAAVKSAPHNFYRTVRSPNFTMNESTISIPNRIIDAIPIAPSWPSNRSNDRSLLFRLLALLPHHATSASQSIALHLFSQNYQLLPSAITSQASRHQPFH
jgi:hypothetical protein